MVLRPAGRPAANPNACELIAVPNQNVVLPGVQHKTDPGDFDPGIEENIPARGVKKIDAA